MQESSFRALCVPASAMLRTVPSLHVSHFIPNGVRDASMELEVTLLVLVTECVLCCVSSEKLCYLWPALCRPG